MAADSFSPAPVHFPADRLRRSRCAKLSRMHNNSNVLAFGARVVGSEMAKMITEAWLDAEFEGGRHERRVNMLMEIENR